MRRIFGRLSPLIQPIVIAVIIALAMSASLAATRSDNQDLFEDVIKQFDCDRILESRNAESSGQKNVWAVSNRLCINQSKNRAYFFTIASARENKRFDDYSQAPALGLELHDGSRTVFKDSNFIPVFQVDCGGNQMHIVPLVVKNISRVDNFGVYLSGSNGIPCKTQAEDGVRRPSLDQIKQARAWLMGGGTAITIPAQSSSRVSSKVNTHVTTPPPPTAPPPTAEYYVIQRFICSEGPDCTIKGHGDSCQAAVGNVQQHVSALGGNPCRYCRTGDMDNTRVVKSTEWIHGGSCQGYP
jgi:hypothetical protein